MSKPFIKLGDEPLKLIFKSSPTFPYFNTWKQCCKYFYRLIEGIEKEMLWSAMSFNEEFPKSFFVDIRINPVVDLSSCQLFSDFPKADHWWESNIVVASDLIDKEEPFLYSGIGVIGRPQFRGVMAGMCQRDAYFGDEALSKRRILIMRGPLHAFPDKVLDPILQRGFCRNMDDIERLVSHHYYNELRMAPEEHHSVIILPSIATKDDREKIVTMMFETFNVFGLTLLNGDVMNLKSTNSRTGVIINHYGDYGYILPIINYIPCYDAMVMIPNLIDIETKFISEMLKRGKVITQILIVPKKNEKIGEKQGNSNFQLIVKNHPEGYDILEDVFEGKVACDSFFTGITDPDCVNYPSIQEALFKSIELTPKQCHNELWNNILLTNLSSQLIGFEHRLKEELEVFQSNKLIESFSVKPIDKTAVALASLKFTRRFSFITDEKNPGWPTVGADYNEGLVDVPLANFWKPYLGINNSGEQAK